MAKLMRLQDRVKKILEHDDLARGSDDHLYCVVLEELRGGVTSQPFGVVLHSMAKYDLPSYESVGRVRRKVQELYPWLKADGRVQKFRTDNEEMFRQYAKNEVR